MIKNVFYVVGVDKNKIVAYNVFNKRAERWDTASRWRLELLKIVPTPGKQRVLFFVFISINNKSYHSTKHNYKLK